MQPNSPATSAAPPAPSAAGNHPSFAAALDANIVMVLAVLLISLLCSLIVNALARLVIHLVNRAASSAPGELPCRARAPRGGRAKRRAAVKALPSVEYSPENGFPAAGGECAVCLDGFVVGERLRVLPECRHGFHVGCVDRWLVEEATCPTCRRCVFWGAGAGEEGRPAAEVELRLIEVVS